MRAPVIPDPRILNRDYCRITGADLYLVGEIDFAVNFNEIPEQLKDVPEFRLERIGLIASFHEHHPRSTARCPMIAQFQADLLDYARLRV